MSANNSIQTQPNNNYFLAHEENDPETKLAIGLGLLTLQSKDGEMSTLADRVRDLLNVHDSAVASNQTIPEIINNESGIEDASNDDTKKKRKADPPCSSPTIVGRLFSYMPNFSTPYAKASAVGNDFPSDDDILPEQTRLTAAKIAEGLRSKRQKTNNSFNADCPSEEEISKLIRMTYHQRDRDCKMTTLAVLCSFDSGPLKGWYLLSKPKTTKENKLDKWYVEPTGKHMISSKDGATSVMTAMKNKKLSFEDACKDRAVSYRKAHVFPGNRKDG